MAWSPLGWECAAVAEVDPAAISVLAARWPGVANLGDVTEISDDDVAALGPIDLVVGGTPCQDLSVAGARAGIDGSRSTLFFDMVRIYEAARRFCGARWILWENVLGAFSTSRGRDFAQVVDAMAGARVAPPAGGWGREGVALGERGLLEWAVLDARWFGLAQRRARVFALLDSGDWAGRAPILLEPDGLRGDSPPRRAPGSGIARPLEASTGGSSGKGERGSFVPETADPLLSRKGSTYSHEGRNNFRTDNLVLDVTPALTSNEQGGARCSAEDGGFVAEIVPQAMSAKWAKDSSGPAGDEHHNLIAVAEKAATLTGGATRGANAPGRRREDDHNLVACFNETQITSPENRSRGDPETAEALAAQQRPPTIAFSAGAGARAQSTGARAEESPPLLGNDSGNRSAPTIAFTEESAHSGAQSLDATLAVRRLTPRECERLMGLPDDYTLVEHRGKLLSDTARYRLLGNSIAVPCLRWIGCSLEAATRAHPFGR